MKDTEIIGNKTAVHVGEILEEKQSIWNPQFISVFIAAISLYLGLFMMNTLVAKYANTMSDSATLVGLVTGVFSVSALVFKVLSGPMTDTYNKKYVVAGAAVLMAISFFGYSVSFSIKTLIGFRLLQGVAQTFTAIAMLALASEYLPKKKMTGGIGIYTLAQAACRAFGPALGLKLVKVIGYKGTFRVGSCFLVLAAVLVLLVKTKPTPKKKLKITLQGILAKEAAIPSIIMGINVLAYSSVSAFLVIFAEEQGVEDIGYFFTVNAIAMLISRPLITRLTDKIGMVKAMLPAMVVFAGAFMLISYSTSLWQFLLAAVLLGISYGAVQPLVQSLSIKSVGNDRRGAASNTNYLGNDFGNMLGPVLCGAIVEHFSYATAWRLMIIPVILSAVFILLCRNKICAIEVGFE